jgi:3'-5' exoribonuclease
MPNLPLIPLHKLPAKYPAEFFVLLSEKQSKKTRDGSPFYTCHFRDGKRSVTSIIWQDSPWFEKCHTQWAVGGFYRITGVLLETERYGVQLEIRVIRDIQDKDKKEGFNEGDFYSRSRFDSNTMFDELTLLVDTEIKDPFAKQLVQTLLTTHKETILQIPASINRYHILPGGWLEHTLAVCKSCLWLTDHYRSLYPEMTPALNRDLIVAGAALHEIGRVLEMQPIQIGQLPEPTVQGRLTGHLILGRDIVREAAKTIPELNPDFAALLEHMILTHLTLPEWGSPRLPAISEVLILHHADDLDAKMEMYARCFANDPSPGPFTDRDPILNKHLLKSRSV